MINMIFLRLFCKLVYNRKLISDLSCHFIVCSKLGEMIDAQTPPDFVLDTTTTGVFSEAIKSLTNSLGIPTVATSYGETGELR